MYIPTYTYMYLDYMNNDTSYLDNTFFKLRQYPKLLLTYIHDYPNISFDTLKIIYL